MLASQTRRDPSMSCVEPAKAAKTPRPEDVPEHLHRHRGEPLGDAEVSERDRAEDAPDDDAFGARVAVVDHVRDARRGGRSASAREGLPVAVTNREAGAGSASRRG